MAKPSIMELLIQPNRWSCVLTSFAMATDISEQELIKALRHNGSERIFPDLPEPLCRRGFDPREFVFPLFVRGINVVQVDAYLIRSFGDQTYSKDNRTEMFLLMTKNKGVLTGVTKNNKYHTVAWNGSEIYDPNGTIYGLGLFSVDCFYLVGGSATI